MVVRFCYFVEEEGPGHHPWAEQGVRHADVGVGAVVEMALVDSLCRHTSLNDGREVPVLSERM